MHVETGWSGRMMELKDGGWRSNTGDVVLLKWTKGVQSEGANKRIFGTSSRCFNGNGWNVVLLSTTGEFGSC